MSGLKETPVKTYSKKLPNSQSMCRHYCGIYDLKHTKNLYHRANVHLPSLAEGVYGGKLPNEDSLPYLLCRPCERRLGNFKKFRNTISGNQHLMTQKKRCIESSPSAPTGKEKIARTQDLPLPQRKTTRRSLSFETSKELEQPQVLYVLYNIKFASTLIYCTSKN